MKYKEYDLHYLFTVYQRFTAHQEFTTYNMTQNTCIDFEQSHDEQKHCGFMADDLEDFDGMDELDSISNDEQNFPMHREQRNYPSIYESDDFYDPMRKPKGDHVTELMNTYGEKPFLSSCILANAMTLADNGLRHLDIYRMFQSIKNECNKRSHLLDGLIPSCQFLKELVSIPGYLLGEFQQKYFDVSYEILTAFFKVFPNIMTLYSSSDFEKAFMETANGHYTSYSDEYRSHVIHMVDSTNVAGILDNNCHYLPRRVIDAMVYLVPRQF